MNVLLVDDDPLMRKMVKLVLQKRGFQVFDASNSTEALAVAEGRPIDLLVTDVVLGEMDGWALARLLTERHTNLPVVFISGYPVDFDCKRQNHACWRFLQKPFLPQDLVHVISALLCATA